jgi:hypothetical protein
MVLQHIPTDFVAEIGGPRLGGSPAVPLDWARTQNNLGLVLWRLGERESGTAKLEEAVAAYRDALKEKDPRARATYRKGSASSTREAAFRRCHAR